MENKKIELIKDLLLELSEEERMVVFSNFCCECGSGDPGCRCWNND
jgi:hypothetical protein